MKVEKVSATIRYSQDTGKGAWKVIELGAEGSVNAREQWQSAQAFLYAELGKQMKSLWANGSANGTPNHAGAEVNGPDDAESRFPGPAEPEPTQTPREHWCEEHQAPFTQRKGKDGKSWWSHKAPDGSWCREPAERRCGQEDKS